MFAVLVFVLVMFYFFFQRRQVWKKKEVAAKKAFDSFISAHRLDVLTIELDEQRRELLKDWSAAYFAVDVLYLCLVLLGGMTLTTILLVWCLM